MKEMKTPIYQHCNDSPFTILPMGRFEESKGKFEAVQAIGILEKCKQALFCAIQSIIYKIKNHEINNYYHIITVFANWKSIC